MRTEELSVFELKKCAVLFRACAHPVRLRIILNLNKGPLCVMEVQDVIGLPENETSQHLRKLQHVGVLHNERKGKKMMYSLRPGILENIEECVKSLNS